MIYHHCSVTEYWIHNNKNNRLHSDFFFFRSYFVYTPCRDKVFYFFFLLFSDLKAGEFFKNTVLTLI